MWHFGIKSFVVCAQWSCSDWSLDLRPEVEDMLGTEMAFWAGGSDFFPHSVCKWQSISTVSKCVYVSGHVLKCATVSNLMTCINESSPPMCSFWQDYYCKNTFFPYCDLKQLFQEFGFMMKSLNLVAFAIINSTMCNTAIIFFLS